MIAWGRFQFAHGGALFLDEVGDLAPEMQPKLLRVLQEGEFEAVGDSVTRRANVRMIIASNHDLKGTIRVGRFRGRPVLPVECFSDRGAAVARAQPRR